MESKELMFLMAVVFSLVVIFVWMHLDHRINKVEWDTRDHEQEIKRLGDNEEGRKHLPRPNTGRTHKG